MHRRLWQLKHTLGIFVLLTTTVFLVACQSTADEESTETGPPERIETIRGTIFPFSVSIATKATHRLEYDGSLVAYLASQDLELSRLEGLEVELDGAYRLEDLRQLFWVTAARPMIDEEASAEPQQFATTQFAFTYPANWEYSTAPNGVSYFLDKGDPGRRVFLTFSAEDLTPEDKEKTPNVLVANMTGIKNVVTEQLSREREELTLFSNLYDRKYRFVLTANVNESNKKKAYFALLNSFVEGEDLVQRILSEAQAKEKARSEEIELIQERFAQLQATLDQAPTTLPPVKATEEIEVTEESAPEPIEAPKISAENSAPAINFEQKETKQVVIPVPSTAPIAQSPTLTPKTDLPVAYSPFVNLVDQRAFSYTSSYYQFSLQVPFGFWFQNIGASSGALANVFFADNPLEDLNTADFSLQILGGVVEKMTEEITDNEVILSFPRNQTTYFQLRGPHNFRDAIWSIYESLENFLANR